MREMSDRGTIRFPNLPERIKGLADLAYNLWWSWHPQARALFRTLDYPAWHESGHNPVLMLANLTEQVLADVARDPQFLARYDAVMAQFDVEPATDAGWFTAEYGHASAPLAYLSAEYGLHASLPVYAGGLGILAGDHLKECSDLAVPVIGVGMIYAQGYVRQRIREDGWQDDVEQDLDRTYDPITRVLGADGEPLVVQVPVFEPPVHVAVWKAAVGRVPLYLMDTSLEINQPWDRAITQRLYTSDPEQRLRQEIVLGMGGMCVLASLGLRPAGLHLNEGHPSLAILERIRSFVEAGAGFNEALEQVRKTTIFTTHTPVAAGTDVFPFTLMDKYFGAYYTKMGTSRDEFLQLGMDPHGPDAGFNMTVFALRATHFCNAVSRRHGQVARKMWAHLWPDRPEDQVPIDCITNGVHLPTWIEPLRTQALLTKYVGADWLQDQDRPGVWELVEEIPDSELWQAHLDRKGALLAVIDARARERWHREGAAPGTVLALGPLLTRDALTIGFARRFTGYKRPDLILHDIQRFKRLLNDTWHPLQIIFSGKAHPADSEGKRLIQAIFRLAQDPECAGRIAFVEDYDQHLARYLVAGVDVWLNNPLPPLEASGTSGMKASINGVPNLSVLDGWWIEGYNGHNGWALGGDEVDGDRTAADADALYALLEKQIVPLYYERSDDGVPHGFVEMMKNAIKSVAPQFSTKRMVKEYASRFYVRIPDFVGNGGTS
jgi:starch phosphorylase